MKLTLVGHNQCDPLARGSRGVPWINQKSSATVRDAAPVLHRTYRKDKEKSLRVKRRSWFTSGKIGNSQEVKFRERILNFEIAIIELKSFHRDIKSKFTLNLNTKTISVLSAKSK